MALPAGTPGLCDELVCADDDESPACLAKRARKEDDDYRYGLPNAGCNSELQLSRYGTNHLQRLNNHGVQSIPIKSCIFNVYSNESISERPNDDT